MLDSILQAIADDMTPEAARTFAEAAARFLAESAGDRVPVTPAADAERLYALTGGAFPDAGRPLADVLGEAERLALANAIRLSHPMYLGHQVSAPLPVAVWADTLISAMNNSLAVQEMSPAGTAIEARLIRWMCELAGLPGSAGGTFTSGGTEATFTALLAARAAVRPDAWADGLGPRPPVLVCGEHAHYAITRAAGELGLGTSSVVPVPSAGFRMDAVGLELVLDRLRDEGRDVMAVVATAGSTPTGSFDDLEAIGTLCAARGLWLHVDAAHGASALLAPRRRHLLRGLAHARSIAWDPHKMMLMPLSAGMVLVRDERALTQAFAQRAPYLFHDEGTGRTWDTGPRSFACSRRFDALKVWMALQRHGADGIGALFDHLSDLAAGLHDRVTDSAEFEAIHQPECNILCFRWLGDGRRSDAELDDLNRLVRQQYNRSGEGWITATRLNGRQVLRVTVMNPRTTPAHLDRLLEGLAREGQVLLAGGGA